MDSYVELFKDYKMHYFTVIFLRTHMLRKVILSEKDMLQLWIEKWYMQNFFICYSICLKFWSETQFCLLLLLPVSELSIDAIIQ